jgi:nucleoside-diphosphate-sugar epimerase
VTTDPHSPSNPLIAPDEIATWFDAIPQPVALTGGTGFVGSHLVDTLCAAGVRPRVLVRDLDNPRWIADAGAELVLGSLSEEDALDRLVDGAGTVFHLAGVVRAGRESDFDLGNRVGTENLVGAIRRRASDARLVHVSSLAAVGPSADPAGRGPDDPAAPISAYGRSKLGSERSVATIGDDGWWCVLRPPAIYGPRDTDIFEFFKMAAKGVAAIPAGERWLTIAWVGDVVRAITAAAARGDSGAVYHLGAPRPQRLDEVFAELAAAGGCRVQTVPVPAFVIRAAGLAGSTLQRLGWRRTPLTVDKTRELLARHWTSETETSLAVLGLGDGLPFHVGAEQSWSWYRMMGWLG